MDLDGLAAERVVAVLAHPDDEVLGCGALLARVPDITLVHVTDGAPRDGADAERLGLADWSAYARARWAEAEAGLDLAGVPASRHIGFGVPDQEAAFQLPALARRLEPFVRAAEAVLTHAFEGGHPDHDAVAYAVHAAVQLARAQGGSPRIVEMPFYHGGPEGWIRQRFLPHPGAGPQALLRLSQEEQRLKQRMAAAHRTQSGVLADFRLDRERFRLAPAYAFATLPNRGRLLYERHRWNLDGRRWLECVRQADAALGLDPSPWP